jgi:hypothetical protein
MVFQGRDYHRTQSPSHWQQQAHNGGNGKSGSDRTHSLVRDPYVFSLPAACQTRGMRVCDHCSEITRIRYGHLFSHEDLCRAGKGWILMGVCLLNAFCRQSCRPCSTPYVGVLEVWETGSRSRIDDTYLLSMPQNLFLSRLTIF